MLQFREHYNAGDSNGMLVDPFLRCENFAISRKNRLGILACLCQLVKQETFDRMRATVLCV